jgi:hypothetical protein
MLSLLYCYVAIPSKADIQLRRNNGRYGPVATFRTAAKASLIRSIILQTSPAGDMAKLLTRDETRQFAASRSGIQ